MSETRAGHQQAIVSWFNSVYERKGDRYLRPLRAYYVFPELLGAREGQQLLDIACGLGRLLEAAREYGVGLSGLDISPVAVARARQNVPEAKIDEGNAESLPYPDESFDLVTCLGSLERVIDRDKALAEMTRIGKPDAKYCLLVRNSETVTWRSRSYLPFVANTGNAGADTLAGWTQRFERNGYRIIAIHPDQYPLQKRARWKSLFLRPVDHRSIRAAPLANANEFIFVMEKRR